MRKFAILAGILTLTVACSRDKQAEKAAMVEKAESERARLSNLATDMLNSAAEARSHLKDKDEKAAISALDRSLADFDRIAEKAPGSRAIPIYAEIATVSIWQPQAVVENGKEIPIAKSSPEGTRNRAVDGTPKPAISDMAGQVTATVVDPQAAADHIRAAKSAIQNQDWAGASAALEAVQRTLATQSVAGDLPLLRARQNFVLARHRVDSGDWEGVGTALQESSQALSQYASAPNQKFTTDANKLKSKVDDLAANLDKRHDKAAKQIDKWWDESAGWLVPPNQAQTEVVQKH